MKKILFSLVLVSFCLASAYSQRDTSMLDRLAITVFNLRKDTLIGLVNDTIVGTGVFIAKSDSELYFVTAAHVAKVMDKKSTIVLQGESGKAIQLKITDFSSPVKWTYHSVADLAVLRLNCEQPIIDKYLQNRFLPIEVVDSTKTAISRNTLLTVLGFPLGLGTSGYFSPLSFRSYPSSALITLKRFDVFTPQTFIILENPSVGGYSGGPVYNLGVIEQGGFRVDTGGLRLTGFIHGTIDGKLTAMTPAFYLRDLIK